VLLLSWKYTSSIINKISFELSISFALFIIYSILLGRYIYLFYRLLEFINSIGLFLIIPTRYKNLYNKQIKKLIVCFQTDKSFFYLFDIYIYFSLGISNIGILYIAGLPEIKDLNIKYLRLNICFDSLYLYRFILFKAVSLL
jgi:hypothetical protein